MGRPKGSKNKFSSGVHSGCRACGKQFYVRAGRGDTAKYCSQACYNTVKREMRINVPDHPRNCVVCSSDFIGTKTAKYCSETCRNIGAAARDRPRKTTQCEYCAKDFTYMGWQTYTTRFCSRECRLAAKPFGVGNTGFRRAFKKRGWPIDRCEWCGYSEHPEILGFHHKDRNRKNNALDNLAIVCPNCHSLEHGHFINHPIGNREVSDARQQKTI